jgi:hypothetical protein
MKVKNSFTSPNGVWFKETDVKKITMMSGAIQIVSTVCPDYPNNGKKYTFQGTLGSGVSLTAKEHLENVPKLLGVLTEHGFEPKWSILLADLPEVIESQRDFFERVSGTKEEYLSLCSLSTLEIQRAVGDLAMVETFSSFYSRAGLNYLEIQEGVATRLREEGRRAPFQSRFASFAASRRPLAEKFRGRRLSEEELLDAAAHGMSLYITHGTLLRKIYMRQNLIVINHRTPNLQNFYLCNFVSGFENLIKTIKFPLGVLEEELY